MRLAIAMLLCAPLSASAFSSGSTDCNVPQHGFQPSAGNGGYALSLPASYQGGQAVTVTLTGATAFKGLLLFGGNGNGARVGNWQFPAGFRGVLNCSGSDTNTLTHADATTKAAPIAFTWTAPPAGAGAVTFDATVMVNFSTFFIIQATVPEQVDALFGNGFEG